MYNIKKLKIVNENIHNYQVILKGKVVAILRVFLTDNEPFKFYVTNIDGGFIIKPKSLHKKETINDILDVAHKIETERFDYLFQSEKAPEYHQVKITGNTGLTYLLAPDNHDNAYYENSTLELHGTNSKSLLKFINLESAHIFLSDKNITGAIAKALFSRGEDIENIEILPVYS